MRAGASAAPDPGGRRGAESDQPAKRLPFPPPLSLRERTLPHPGAAADRRGAERGALPRRRGGPARRGGSAPLNASGTPASSMSDNRSRITLRQRSVASSAVAG